MCPKFVVVDYTVSLLAFLASRIVILLGTFDSLYSTILMQVLVSNVVDLLPIMYMVYTHARMFKRESMTYTSRGQLQMNAGKPM